MTSYGGDVFYFIAVNYNNSKFSIKYIESVNDIKIDTKDKLNIIIVDNNSEEKELEDLEFYCKTCNNVVLIKNHCNVGYFSGLNIGLRTIKYSSKNTVIVGNNDLTFDDNFIFNVKKNYIINKLMVICPNVITKDGKHQNPHVINRISYFNRLKAKIYNQNYYVGQLFRIINQFLKRIFTKDSDNTEYDYSNWNWRMLCAN
jgi:GT2 family glycosyltransferase